MRAMPLARSAAASQRLRASAMNGAWRIVAAAVTLLSPAVTRCRCRQWDKGPVRNFKCCRCACPQAQQRPARRQRRCWWRFCLRPRLRGSRPQRGGWDVGGACAGNDGEGAARLVGGRATATARHPSLPGALARAVKCKGCALLQACCHSAPCLVRHLV